MAIVQISQIQNRKGLQIDLPQPLAGAELGWSTDTRQLYIGNGTIAEGAPVVGNTEILTEFSDLLVAAKYTYKGAAAGYTVQTGPTVGQPVVLTQQAWMDQWASVKDFGAVGDGVTDDTQAINRALNQLYCNPDYTQPAIRRSLFFPAGRYKITDTINIPTYATLYGEGPDNTIIQLEPATPGTVAYVAQYADSRQQVVSPTNTIGNGGATLPTDIHIANMQFLNTDLTTSVFLVASATNCSFTGVAFVGQDNNPTTPTNNSRAVDFESSVQTVKQINFTECTFTNLTYAVNTTNNTRSVVFDKSYFDTLYRGVVLRSSAPGTPGPTGTRITNSTFDMIFAEAIIVGGVGSPNTVVLNASAHNVFYNVGNSFGSIASAVIIGFYDNNNISIGDMFERTESAASVYSRILVDGQNVIAFTNGEKIEMGTFTRSAGKAAVVVAASANTAVFTQDVESVKAFSLNYTIEQSGNVYRTGVFSVASFGIGGNPVTYQDDYIENATTNIILSAAQTGNTVTVQSTATTTGGTMYYSVNYLS